MGEQKRRVAYGLRRRAPSSSLGASLVLALLLATVTALCPSLGASRAAMAKPQSEARRAVTPTLPATRSTAPISSMRPQALARALAAQAKRPLARRIDFWSAAFLGTPYFAAQEEDSESQVSPADRARGVHRLELGWVDCESFVEKVMALSLGRSLEEVSDHLRRIRFHEGVPGTTRRHFTVVKGWLAHNEAAGYLRDLTRGIGGSATRTLEKDLAPTPLWRPYYLRRFFSLGVRAPLGTARIDHIPLGAFPTSGRGGLLGRLPHGAVMHVVSAPHERSPYLVTHVGFVIKTPWGPVLRHASRSPRRRRVEDRPLGPYLVYAGRTPAGPEMRTGLGVHLSELLSPSARPSP